MKRKPYMAAILAASGVLLFGLAKPAPSLATVPGANEAVDVSTTGGDPNGNAGGPVMSQDGRYIVFVSSATNLVSPATNGQSQIFVRDRLSNTTTLVSVSSSGTEGNNFSTNPRISTNGRYVVFESTSSNLVSGDTNGTYDIFIHDMSTGTTQLVSTNSSGVEGNSNSQYSDVDAQGDYVVFASWATNLVSSPTVSGSNIYEKNLLTGEVKLLSQSPSGEDGNANSASPKISCEGRFVVFQSNATNLVNGDPNTNKNLSRIYVVDMLKPIAPMYIMDQPNNLGMGNPTISCNGDYIGFTSESSNIVPNDTNGYSDAFIYDRTNDTFHLVSVASDGTQGNGGVGDFPAVSNDGKYVVFDSMATNLVPENDTNGHDDVFLHNTQTGVTELITRDSNDTASDGSSSASDISSDGRYVSYQSSADNLVDGFSPPSGGYPSAVYASQAGASDDY